MKRIGFMVQAGCFPTKEAAEAKQKLLNQKGVQTFVEDIDALTMRELVSAIMCVVKQLEEINKKLRPQQKEEPADCHADTSAADAGRKITRFGLEIQQYLVRNRMSQNQLAVKAGVGPGTISRAMYADLVTPRENTMAKIAVAAEIPYSKYRRLIDEELGCGGS